MTTPRFIQISTLHSFPAALLNRDDSGLAKRMPFGGVIRTRVSSQCLKRHWRLADDEFALAKADPELHNSVRSRALYRIKIADALQKEGVPQPVVEAVLTEFQKSLYGESAKAGKKAKNEAEEAKSPLDRSEVLVLGEPEIRFLTEEARPICQQAGEDAKKAAEAAKDHLKKKKVRDAFLALKYGAGIDGALFGRFVSGDPEARVSAAVHVAHALTVHPECSETDYFTAVDDLLTAVEGGSGHLGAAELTSGLYYNYVVVDVPLLVSNLNGNKSDAANPDQWLKEDRSLAGRVVRNLIHLVATVSPGAKLGATAPYDYAGLVLVEAGSRQPRTLANAFLEPVRLDRPELFPRSVQALSTYLEQMDAMYGNQEQRWLACRLPETNLPGAARLSLPQAAQAAEEAIKAGQA